jgi:hypothetical protein
LCVGDVLGEEGGVEGQGENPDGVEVAVDREVGGQEGRATEVVVGEGGSEGRHLHTSWRVSNTENGFVANEDRSADRWAVGGLNLLGRDDEALVRVSEGGEMGGKGCTWKQVGLVREMTMAGMKMELRTETKIFTRWDCFEISRSGRHILFHATLKRAKENWMRKRSVEEMSWSLEEMM